MKYMNQSESHLKFMNYDYMHGALLAYVSITWILITALRSAESERLIYPSHYSNYIIRHKNMLLLNINKPINPKI